MENAHPACVRKLIEGAVNYARALDFEPHRDYRLARKIFGDIKSEDCAVEYTYGHEGKPYYISGPNESQNRSKQTTKSAA